MRYRIIILPFLDRYHVTMTSWDSQLGESSKRVAFWDVGPEHISSFQAWAILSYVAGDLAADEG